MWFPLSLATAFLAGTSDAVSKHLVSKHQARFVAFSKAFWASLFLIPFLMLSTGPEDKKIFWTSLLFAIPLEIIGALLFQKSLQLSPLSLSMPFMAFTPVFLLGLGWIFLGESVSRMGIFGVFLVSLGAFFLMTEIDLANPMRTLGKLNKQKGPILMITVSFIYAITSVLAKKALLASSPFFFCGTYYIFITCGLFLFLKNPKQCVSETVFPSLLFITVGACEAMAFLFQFHAFQQTEAAFVIAVKRLSLLLALVYGILFFREEVRFSKIAGAFAMISGAAMIALAG